MALILINTVIITGFVFAVGYAGFLVGREKAEQRAHNTIANLRRANAAYRQRLERLEERNARQARQLGAYEPKPVPLPEWMNP